MPPPPSAPSGGEERYSGDVLMEVGYPLPMLQDDYQPLQLYLEAI